MPVFKQRSKNIGTCLCRYMTAKLGKLYQEIIGNGRNYLMGQQLERCQNTCDYLTTPHRYEWNVPEISPAAARVADYPRLPPPSAEACMQLPPELSDPFAINRKTCGKGFMDRIIKNRFPKA